MEIKQIYNFTNSALTETLGTSAVLSEDLSNVVDMGTAVFNANAFDAYVKSLVNHIGKVIFVDRPYRGSAPSVLMDGWEYGSVLEKISSEMPTAIENPSWKLTNGTSYDPHVFNAPSATAKFFNKMTTFEIDRSITEMQVKQSFSSATQLNAFISMIFNEIDKALTIRTDDLIMRTINNMTMETLLDNKATRAVNLLSLYNTKFDKELTSDQAVTDPEFIRYAAYVMGNYIDRMTRMSTLFNIGGKQRFTPKDMLHVVMLSEFKNAADIYLQSDTFHDEYTRLTRAETVPFWQGSGTDYGFESTSAVYGKPASQESATTPSTVNQTGVLCVMFDRDALGVANFDRRVNTEYNPKAEFTNYFYKQDCRYFNDTNENFVVFYAGDEESDS